MHMEVGDGLADDVVDGDECSLCSESVEHGAGDPLHADHERRYEALRQVQERLDMANRSYQDMTFEHRPVIEEGDDVLVPRYNRRVELPADDLANHIAHRHEISVRELCRQ
jgi:hypothetical protein